MRRINFKRRDNMAKFTLTKNSYQSSQGSETDSKSECRCGGMHARQLPRKRVRHSESKREGESRERMTKVLNTG